MKTIAVCFHGQPRGLGAATEYQNKNLIKRDDISVDVFFHTWDYSDRICGINERVLENYTPKLCVFEKPLDRSVTEKYQNPHTPRFNAHSNYCHYHSVYMADCVRREYQALHGIKYDWVVCTRFDIALNIRLDFERMDNSKVYQSDFNIDVYMTNGYKVQNPVFAVGNSENMERYSAMLPNIDTLNNMADCIDGHSIFGANLRLQNMVDCMMPLDMKHPFPPGGRDSSPNSFVRTDFDTFKDW